MSENYEDNRRKELEIQEKQLFAQRVTAAASMASAAFARKQAADVKEMREQMVAHQHQMAEEQRLANFRNTVLNTLPSIESEEEKTQFLTEQLLPKLKEEVDVEIFGPLELIGLWFTTESEMVTTYLNDEAGLDLNEFLSNGNKLALEVETLKTKWEQREKQTQELEKTQASLHEKMRFGIKDLVKILLWTVLFFIGFRIFADLIATALLASVVCGVATHFIWKKGQIKSLKAKILALTPKDDGSALAKESQELLKENQLQQKQWESYKPKIVKYIMKKFKDYIKCDARTLLVEHVIAPQLEFNLQALQSFLPPYSRLSAKHFAEYFLSESDVKECEENQQNIKKQLELAIEHFYKEKTIILLVQRVKPDFVPQRADSDLGLRTVKLTFVPEEKQFEIVMALKEIKAGLGFPELMQLTESVPVVILDSVSPQKAQSAIAKLKAAGAATELL